MQGGAVAAFPFQFYSQQGMILNIAHKQGVFIIRYEVVRLYTSAI